MHRSTLFLALILGLVALFALSGCWWFEGLFPSPSPSPSPSPLPANTDMDRKDFTMFSLEGGTITLSSFKGKPVLLVFFSPGCSHCKAEVPALNEVYRKYKDTHGLVVLGAGYGLEDSIRNFVTSTGAEYIVGYFTDRTIIETYGVEYVPHNVFFDRNGNIVKTYTGPMTLSALESFLSEIL
jgi:thiol-disulfide isomerase/thioredoxin